MNKKIENFIKRKYKDIDNTDSCDFPSILKNDISIILGEPASGKTHQLEFYSEEKENIICQDLVTVNLKEINISKIDIIFLDSIDEALRNHSSVTMKELQEKLSSYIGECKRINPKIKFVITCRQLEWNEHFSKKLKVIDNSLKVYEIKDLEKKQINILLKDKGINTVEFWNFISTNYLNFLLKNILVILNIIDNYNKYRTQTINYTDIYIDIIKEHLSVKGEGRDELLPPKKLRTEFLDKASSLAAYMMFNKKTTISTKKFSKLSDELYIINNEKITIDDLHILVNSSLFKKEGTDFSFFHDSIKEFLMAYFINKKNTDLKQIKELFSHEMKFYEAFEEVIVYLTNFKSDFFNDIVKFDPLIFKRHPNLNKEQQEKLLSTMLYNLQHEKSIIYGKWKYFNNNSLLNFKMLKDIHLIVRDKVDINNVDNVLFPYLIKLLNYNYTVELENEIFEILDKYNQLPKNQEKKVFTDEDRISENEIKGNIKTRKLLEYSFVDNYNISTRLYDFIKKNHLLNTNIENISMLNFETKLFESIYGITYTNRYGRKKDVSCNYTDYDFEELLPLLNSIPYRDLKYIVPYLKQEDSLKWFEYIKTKEVNNKISLWAIYGLLLHYNSKEVISLIFDYLSKPKIYLYIVSHDIEDMPFDFERISDNFWEFYFQLDIDNEHRASDLMPLLQPSLKDIKKVSKIYPIKKYVKYYVRLRLNESINKYLMVNNDFEIYMNKLWEKQKEQQKKHENDVQKEVEKYENYQSRKQQKQNKANLCENSLQSLTTKQDFYNVFYCEELYREENEGKIDILFKDDKKSKFFKFILQDFNNDTSYLKLKDDVNSTSMTLNLTPLYILFFKNITTHDLLQYINSSENFEKLFWHVFRYSKMDEAFFINLVENHFDYFIELFIETISLSLEQSKNKKIINFQNFITIIEKLNKFNSQKLYKLIQLILTFDSNVFIIIESYELVNLLNILKLNNSNYDFIQNLMIKDDYSSSEYLTSLLTMDTQNTIDNYMKLYIKEKKYIKKSCYLTIKSFFKKEKNHEHKYNNPLISPKKINLLINLILSIKNTNTNTIEEFNQDFLIIIINDYYEFFKEYEHENGLIKYSAYSNMSSFFNNLWTIFGETSQYINLLKNLSKNNNSKLSDIAKFTLDSAYNQQQKDKIRLNSYYKEIFDKDEKLKKKNNNSKWNDMSMFKKVTIVAALATIIGVAFNFIPSDSPSNNNTGVVLNGNNNGNITISIDNSKTENINITVNKINNLINEYTTSIKDKKAQKRKEIHTKLLILHEAKKINKKRIPIMLKNEECRNKAKLTENALDYEIGIMYKICDDVFK